MKEYKSGEKKVLLSLMDEVLVCNDKIKKTNIYRYGGIHIESYKVTTIVS